MPVSIGIWTLVGAALGPVVAALGFGMRRLAAVMDGRKEPERPFLLWCVMLALVGAFAGSMWQGVGFAECRDAGYKVGQCLLLPASARQ